MFVPPDLHIGPLSQTVIYATPPTVCVRRVGVNDDWELSGLLESHVIVEIRPDINEVLAQGVEPGLRPMLTTIFEYARPAWDGF